MFCLKCQHLVMKGEKCDRCGLPLPGYADPPPAPSNASRLRQQLLLFRSGDLERTEFEGYLDRHTRQCEQLLSQTTDENFHPEARAEMTEEISTGRRGIMAYMQGLDSVRAWMLTRDDDDLKRGIALAEQADTLVAQAITLNYETHRTHLESTRDFLKHLGYEES